MAMQNPGIAVKKRLTIGIDFDGVIADTTALKQKLAKEMFGVELDANVCKERFVVEQGLMTREQYRSLMARVCGEPEVGLRMDALEGGVDLLRKLQNDGHALRIITARADADLEVAKRWSSERGLDIEFISVGYGGSKTEPATGLDLYIDDDLSKLLPLQGIVPNLLMFNWPYNAHEEAPSSIRRVSSWSEISAAIETLFQTYASKIEA